MLTPPRRPLPVKTPISKLSLPTQTDIQQKNRRKVKKTTWRRLTRATSSPVADALAARPSISPRLPKALTTTKMRTRMTTSRTLRTCSSRMLYLETTLAAAISAVRKVFHLFTIITATVGIGYCAAVQGVSGRRMNTFVLLFSIKRSRGAWAQAYQTVIDKTDLYEQ